MGAREMIHRTSLCVGAQVQSPVLYAPLALPGAALENQQLSESPQNEFCFWMKSPDFSHLQALRHFFCVYHTGLRHYGEHGDRDRPQGGEAMQWRISPSSSSGR